MVVEQGVKVKEKIKVVVKNVKEAVLPNITKEGEKSKMVARNGDRLIAFNLSMSIDDLTLVRFVARSVLA